MQELSHTQFLSLLSQRGIGIAVNDGRLKINAPAGAVDPELLAELTRRKPELLDMMQRAEVSSRPRPLVPMERNGKIPQTSAQQGIWLVDFFNPGNVAYNIPESFCVEGPVHLEALQRAVDGLLARHESLRTYFYEDEGELLQAVSVDASAVVGFTDLSALHESEQAQKLGKLVAEQSKEPFDLSRPPMIRFHLFKLADNLHLIFFNVHHIVADRTSTAIVQRDLTQLYQIASGQEATRLPDLPVQYPDYAIWAGKVIAEGGMAGQIQYWKTKLAGAPPYLELPYSKPYPEERASWGATVLVSIPELIRNGLNELARQEGTTTFMMLFAAFAVLLYRQSGKEDFCLGSPFTHRNHVETESLIGMFVNMLVLRCQFGEATSFRAFLKSVRATALEAYDNSDVPFQALVRALKPDLRSRRSPLFQIVFGFDSEASSGQGAMFEVDTNPGMAKFDLSLHLRETPDGIKGWFEYCTDLFDAASIEKLANQFIHLLGQIIQNPDRTLQELAIDPAGIERY